ncbi:MAG: DegT/DnrJ/EryC1/StrS family aminotransferase [Oligoflexia bacterium]|nr:DegT/DnrJ/EryC1/StrS family aminotransferase [Oligoflexia bacterium]
MTNTTNKIPLSRPFLGEEEASAAAATVLSGWVTQGPKVKAFEDAFASYVDSKYACAVANCTAALHMALLAVGVQPSDIVLTVSHSFIATANSIRLCQAEPYFIDIDLQTLNMDPSKLREILQSSSQSSSKRKIAAILVVHQIGMPADMEEIMKIANEFNLPVVEDAACASGSEIFWEGKWQKIGYPIGDIACFSFHPRKVISTGEGGMLTTNNSKYDSFFRLFRQHGMSISDLDRHNLNSGNKQSKKNQVLIESYDILGHNYRMSDIAAAIGIEQLKKLPMIISKRRKLAELYLKELSPLISTGLISADLISVQKEKEHARSNWQSFFVYLNSQVNLKTKLSRNDLILELANKNIASKPAIMNAHQELPYKKENEDKDEKEHNHLTNSELARERGMLLPIYTQMSESDVCYVCECLKKIF